MSKGDGIPFTSYELYNAMTLRDYFAAAAMQGLIAGLSSTSFWAELSAKDLATEAFEHADAMLAERDK